MHLKGEEKSMKNTQNKNANKKEIDSVQNEAVKTSEEKNNAQETKKAEVKDIVPVNRIINDKMLALLNSNMITRNGTEYSSLPFLPNKNGFCNVKAVKSINGYEFQGINQLVAKMYLHERGQDNDNIGTFMNFTHYGTSIRAGEKGFILPFYDKEKNRTSAVRYFSESQASDREKLPYVPTKEEQRYGFTQESANVQEYITNYLSCVHENRAFHVSAEVADKFRQNLASEIEKDSLSLFKICNQAAKRIYEMDIASGKIKTSEKSQTKEKEPMVKQKARDMEMER